MNKMDLADPELVELVEEEIRELLEKNGFDKNAPIIKGSATKALEGDAANEDAIMELVKAMDDYIPEPKRELDKPFLMPIEDVFSSRAAAPLPPAVSSRVSSRSTTKLKSSVSAPPRKPSLLALKCSRRTLDQGQAGDNVGILLRGIERDDIERGQVLAKPGTITPHTEFDAEVYILTKEEGGRHTPFFKGYKPQFYFRTTDVTGEVELPADKEMVMPGDTITFKVKLLAPIAMEQGLRFAIREGGRTVGAGVVTKIVK